MSTKMPGLSNQELTDRVIQVALKFTFTTWGQEVSVPHKMSRKPQFWTIAGQDKPAVVFGSFDGVNLKLKAVCGDPAYVLAANDPLTLIVRVQ